MCLAMFQGVWGRAYNHFPQKIVFLSCIFIFEIGSLVVALAPNSVAVIAGRAVQGLGGAGITSGCYLIAAYIVQLSHLTTVMGLFGAIWACASALGPVLGGVFTHDLTWRWCFWINLPLGGVTFLIILLFFSTPPHSRFFKAPPWRQCPREFDALGVILGLGAWICLLLVLQDGGIVHAWDSSFSIGLLARRLSGMQMLLTIGLRRLPSKPQEEAPSLDHSRKGARCASKDKAERQMPGAEGPASPSGTVHHSGAGQV